MKRRNDTKTALFCLALTTCLAASVNYSSADETAQTTEQSTSQTAPQQKRHYHGFRMGVCVGQTLSQQGVTLSSTPGDTSNRDAFKAAIQSCRAQFKNRAPASSTTEPAS